MSYEVRFYPHVRTDKKNIDKESWERISTAIREKLTKRPEYFGKPLRGTLKQFWRLRVGDYRVGYLIRSEENEVHVVAVGHRKEIYDRLKCRF